MNRSHFQRGSGWVWLALIFAATVFAQVELDPEKDITIEVRIEPPAVAPGAEGKLNLNIQLPPYTHITNRELGFFSLIPEASSQLTWGEPVYPPGSLFEGDTVYQGKVAVSLPFIITSAANPGDRLPVKAVLGYQVCTETDPVYCTPPVERNIEAVIDIGNQPQKSTSIAASSKNTSPPDNFKLTLEQRATRALESGSLLALLWIFLGGVALSFTPCVYPVIPITIAFIGARSGRNRGKGLALSLVFVLGLALVYSSLGLIAAATGGVFGLSTQNHYVIGFVTIVFLVMGAGMLGAFELALPSSLQTRLADQKRGGYLGALLVGATTGLVAAPCVGPVLVALLSWVSASRSLGLGFLYLFVFACGLGLLFVIIGTFAGALTALPKAGQWMESVKKVFGIILIAAAFYFGKALVSDNLFTILLGAGLLMLAGMLGAYCKLESDAPLGSRIGRGAAVLALLAGAFYVLLGLAQFQGWSFADFGKTDNAQVNRSSSSETYAVVRKASKSGVKWIWDDIPTALNRAVSERKPVIVDFGAEWCAACKELEHKTFSQEKVFSLINDGFIAVKFDGTDITDNVRKVWSQYRVKGLPTVLFLTPQGEEIDRFEAFRTAEQVAPLLKRIRDGALEF
ncbi:MAG: cytochrome c biogenesis protein CcdA [Calditrichota bacterium]